MKKLLLGLLLVQSLPICKTALGQSTDLVVIGTRKYNRTEFKVNSGGFEVNQRANLALLSTRNFVVAWHEGGPTDCYGRVFDPQGNATGGIVLLHPFGSSGWQYGPSPAPLPNGGFVATWGGESSYADAQRFDSNRSPVGGEISVANLNAWPAVASRSNGEFVVTFGLTDSEVYARRFDSNGGGSNLFRVGPFVSGWFYPSVAYAPDGRFTIAWPAACNILARTYLSNEFSAAGPEFQVNT